MHVDLGGPPGADVLERASQPLDLCEPPDERRRRCGDLGRYGVARGEAEQPLRPCEALSRDCALAGPLADPYVSRSCLWIAPDRDGALLTVPPGASVRVLGVPARGEVALGGLAISRGVPIVLADRVVLLLHLCRAERSPVATPALVGASDVMEALRHAVGRAASSPVPVLLRGESGTGKELVALEIHRRSGRHPWVALNMAALPATTAPSELLGHARGAFTGAFAQHAGAFERAHGGTLLLDEIGEAPVEVQGMLLRVLETGDVQPVGGSRSRRVDVRVIAATDRDLEAAIGDGRFRAPLLHRLAGIHVEVPPLRERLDDLGRLLLHALRAELAALGAELPSRSTASPWLPAELVERMALYDWPGNVRELRNVARAVALAGAGKDCVEITPELARWWQGVEPPAVAPAKAPVRVAPSRLSDEELLAALKANRWEVRPTARALGMSKTSLYARMEACPAVRKAADLTDEEVREAHRQTGGDVVAMSAVLCVSAHGLRQRMADLEGCGR